MGDHNSSIGVLVLPDTQNFCLELNSLTTELVNLVTKQKCYIVSHIWSKEKRSHCKVNNLASLKLGHVHFTWFYSLRKIIVSLVEQLLVPQTKILFYLLLKVKTDICICL